MEIVRDGERWWEMVGDGEDGPLLAQVGWLGIFRMLAGMGCVAVGLLTLLKLESDKPAAWD